MRRFFPILFFAIMVAGFVSLAPHKAHALPSCPAPSQDIDGDCGDAPVDGGGKLGGPAPDSVTVRWGCGSAGSDRTCNFMYVFPGNAGQVYKGRMATVRNDDPSPGVYWCINDTGIFNTGACGTFQIQGGPNRDGAEDGINLENTARYSVYMIRITVNQKFFNTNDYMGDFTIYRRELHVNDFSPTQASFPNGSKPVLHVDVMHTTPNAEKWIALGFPDSSWQVYDLTDCYGKVESCNLNTTLPVSLSMPGTYTAELHLGGPSRDDSFQRLDPPKTTTFTIDAASSPPVGGRYKCQGESCVWDPKDSGSNQCQFDKDCAAKSHLECVSAACATVSGPGADQCAKDADCVSPTHKECRGKSCTVVAGAGADSCGSDPQCDVGSLELCADFVDESNVPTVMITGEPRQISVRMFNCGTATWNPSKPDDWVGIKLGSQNPRDNNTWGPARISLSSAVPSGKIGTFTLNINAPTIPYAWPNCIQNGDGTENCNFQWQMVSENVAWFSERTPWTPNSVIKVVDCTPGQAGCPKHLECVSSACAIKDGEGSNLDGCSSVGQACVPGGPKHLECQSSACVLVPGGGADKDGCTAAGQACVPGGPKHLKCAGFSCQLVGGGGPNENGCTSDGQACSGGCAIGSPGCVHNACLASGSCAVIPGGGSNDCAVNPDCPQPAPKTCTITAVPNRLVLPPGGTSTLSWDCAPMPPVPPSCTVDRVPVSLPGSKIVSPRATTEYTLTCSTSGGSSVSTTTIRVYTGDPGGIHEIPPGSGG